MRVKVSAGNRITIPKQIYNDLGLSQGDELILSIKDNDTLIFTKVDNELKKYDEEIKPTNKGKPKKKKSRSTSSKRRVGVRKIESNLEEGKNFTTKKYSECGLVIRTKTKYLNQFCEECQGQLALEYGVLDHPCKYNNIPERIEVEEPQEEPKSQQKENSTSKKIINEIIKNVNKAQSKFDKDIEKLSDDKHINIKKHKSKSTLNTTSDTVIQPVAYVDYKKCDGCGEFFDNGFLLDDVFRCKECTKKDFIKYVKEHKNK